MKIDAWLKGKKAENCRFFHHLALRMCFIRKLRRGGESKLMSGAIFHGPLWYPYYYRRERQKANEN
jgi:hypothetical protein